MGIDRERIAQHLLPELQYSCHHWAHHSLHSGPYERKSSHISPPKSAFLYCLETMSSMRLASDTSGQSMLFGQAWE
ncbi:hypothetical protein BJX96DRAFT_157115 [Aspergillus floccosus]